MEELNITRTMPNSLEAEQSVIGSMIWDRQAIITAGEMLMQDDFYYKQYGIMFQAMVEMNNEGKPVDVVTLQEKLKEKDVPQRCIVLNLSGNCFHQCQPLLI